MSRNGILAAAICGALFAALPAWAAVHTYDLKTTTDGAWSQTALIDPTLIQHVDVWNLVDATTGAAMGPGFSMAPGDVIFGSVRLDHAWTPSNLASPDKPDWFNVQLGGFAGTAYPVDDQLSIDYYLGGQLVANSTTALGGFGNRVTASPDFSKPIPVLTFDRFTFQIQVGQVFDNQSGWGKPSEVSGDLGSLMVFTFAPVPEPAAWALALGGLAALGLFNRTNRQGLPA
jgi:hypothetical protein